MRVAIVHDYIKEYGGAERVLEALHEMFPDAPVFTTVYLPQFLGPHKNRFKNWDIRTSFLQHLPFKGKLISPIRIISPLVFANIDLSSYDLIIVSQTGAYFPNTINTKRHSEFISESDSGQAQTINVEMLKQVQQDSKKKPILICYCHTPPRYLYGYKTAREWKNNPVLRVLGETANHFLRIVDYNASKNVDYFIANSREVASRIKKFYRRDSVVIYPPVDVNSKFKIQNSKLQFKSQKFENEVKKYYLTGGRLARAKGIDIIVEAFSNLGKPLIVFGKGFAGYENELRIKNHESWKDKNHNSLFTIHDSNIKFVGEVNDEEKFELMRNAKAFVFASFDEDFGITPVEAMSVGTPVIAYNSGGVKETVVNGKTGVLFDENNADSLAGAILKFEKMSIDPKECIKQAGRFSKERFEEQIKKFVKSILH